MRTRVLSAIVLAVLVSASCRTTRLAKPVAGTPIGGGSNSQFTVIGTMQSRDRIVTVKTGDAGVVYSVATKDGMSLYENVSAAKLKEEAPALHEFIESGIGGWAGLDLPGTRLPIDARIIDARR